MRSLMTALGLTRRPPPPRPDAGDPHALIEALMAGPIKGPPRITVVGDDAVSGINPAPPRPRT